MGAEWEAGKVRFWMLESVPHMVDARSFTIRDLNFDHVEAPWDLTCAQLTEPRIGTSLNELLLAAVDGVERTDLRARLPRFDLHEEEELFLPGDDVDFPSSWAAVISGEDLATGGAEEIDGDPFAVVAEPFAASGFAVRTRQVAGRVEPPA